MGNSGGVPSGATEKGEQHEPTVNSKVPNFDSINLATPKQQSQCRCAVGQIRNEVGSACTIGCNGWFE